MSNNVSAVAKEKVLGLVFETFNDAAISRNVDDYTIVSNGPVARPEKPMMEKSRNWFFSIYEYFNGATQARSDKYVMEMDKYLRECIWADGRWTVKVAKVHKDSKVVTIPMTFYYRRLDLSSAYKDLVITLKRNRCSVFLDDLVEMYRLVPGELEVLLQPTSARDDISYFVVKTIGDSLIYCPGLWTVKVKWVD